MTTTLVIDPGRALGWSLWTERTLTGCGVVHYLGSADASPEDYAARVGDGVYAYIGQRHVDAVICELMAVHAGRIGSVAHGLIDVQIQGTVVAARSCKNTCRMIPANEWKGSVPKGICAPRAVRTLTLTERRILRAAEARTPLRHQHNMLDAIGIGLYALGRAKRGMT